MHKFTVNSINLINYYDYGYHREERYAQERLATSFSYTCMRYNLNIIIILFTIVHILNYFLIDNDIIKTKFYNSGGNRGNNKSTMKYNTLSVEVHQSLESLIILHFISTIISLY